jgi:hypothetical protein
MMYSDFESTIQIPYYKCWLWIGLVSDLLPKKNALLELGYVTQCGGLTAGHTTTPGFYFRKKLRGLSVLHTVRPDRLWGQTTWSFCLGSAATVSCNWPLACIWYQEQQCLASYSHFVMRHAHWQNCCYRIGRSKVCIGRAVAQLVEALCYKSEGRGFDSQLCH